MNESPKVVDASLAVKWLVEEEDSEKAHALSLTEIALYAPRLLVVE